MEETGAVPTTTSGTDEELREAFEEVEQEKELEELEEMPQNKTAVVEEEVGFISTIFASVSFLPCFFRSDPRSAGGDSC